MVIVCIVTAGGTSAYLYNGLIKGGNNYYGLGNPYQNKIKYMKGIIDSIALHIN